MKQTQVLEFSLPIVLFCFVFRAIQNHPSNEPTNQTVFLQPRFLHRNDTALHTHLEVILVHSISIGNDAGLSVELIAVPGEFLSEPDLVNRVRHVELLKGTEMT